MQKIDYAVFTNKKTSKKLVYYPVAKNANSSAKLFFARHLGLENKFYFIEDKLPRYKHTKEIYKRYSGKYNLINFFPPYTPFKKMNVEERCCIVRDPLKRFVSSYKNRILFHKDPDFYNHNIDLILEKLENNLFENKHFLKQSFWLGSNLNYFTIVANVNNMKTFIKKINIFFGKNCNFPKIQIGGKQLQVKLKNSQIKKIKKIYETDYDLINSRL